ncbi:MAG: MOSC domain-containing protein [Anaerolineae bacterium]
MPAIISICYTPDGIERQPQDFYARVPIGEAHLLEAYGIEGDRKGGHPVRQLNVMSREVLNSLAEQGLKTGIGQMGEQIVLDGFDVADLKPGDQVRIGDHAVIEIGEKRNGCPRFQHIQAHDPAALKGQLGVMARVITSGAIKVGDPVRVISYAAEAK